MSVNYAAFPLSQARDKPKPKPERKPAKMVRYDWYIDGKVYGSQRKAADALGVDQSSINQWCKGYTASNGTTYPPRKNCFRKVRKIITKRMS